MENLVNEQNIITIEDRFGNVKVIECDDFVLGMANIDEDDNMGCRVIHTSAKNDDDKNHIIRIMNTIQKISLSLQDVYSVEERNDKELMDYIHNELAPKLIDEDDFYEDGNIDDNMGCRVVDNEEKEKEKEKEKEIETDEDEETINFSKIINFYDYLGKLSKEDYENMAKARLSDAKAITLDSVGALLDTISNKVKTEKEKEKVIKSTKEILLDILIRNGFANPNTSVVDDIKYITTTDDDVVMVIYKDLSLLINIKHKQVIGRL